MAIRQKQGWEIPESLATPEDIFLNRRSLLKGIAETKEITDEAEAELKEVIVAFKKDFMVRHGMVEEEAETADGALVTPGTEEEAAS